MIRSAKRLVRFFSSSDISLTRLEIGARAHAISSAFRVPSSAFVRKGKGTHAALARARQFLRRYRYFLKLDVEHCFEGLRHLVALETIERIIKDRRVLDLFERIVRTPAGKGIPIGSLSSQWTANAVLDRLDHRVKEVSRIPGYVRYLDDMVLFCDDKDRLRACLEEIRSFLDSPLCLVLKDSATILAPATEGLPFLGWNIHRGMMRLRPGNLRRTKRRLQLRRRQLARGEIDEETLERSVRSVVAHMEHGTTRALRRSWFAAANE